MEFRLTGVKDTDLLILTELDDRSLLSYCQTNKYARNICNNEDFWRNRVYKVYGEVSAKLKSIERKWKDYYLSIVYYTDKYTNNRALKQVALKGDMDLFLYFSQFENEKNVIKEAIEGGNKKIIDFIISSKKFEDGVLFNNLGLYGAAVAANEDLINYFLSKGALSRMIILGGLQSKNEKFVKQIILEQDVKPDLGLIYTVLNGNKKLIDYFISKGANDFNEAAYEASYTGNIDLLKFFLFIIPKTKIVNLNRLLFAAIEGGHIEIVDYLISRGAKLDDNGAKISAKSGGYKDMIRYIDSLIK
jgi:hypothetical protein